MFILICQEVPTPWQLRLHGCMCAMKCGRCSLKCWQAGQRYGMVPADGVLVNSLAGRSSEDALESLHENEDHEQLLLWSRPLSLVLCCGV